MGNPNLNDSILSVTAHPEQMSSRLAAVEHEA